MKPGPTNVDRWPCMTMSSVHRLNVWRTEVMVMTEGERRPRKSLRLDTWDHVGKGP